MKVKYFLTLTDSESESGYSISSLFVKYRTQLVGYYWAEVFGKEFPLQFSFNQMDDAASIRAELVDENGFHYRSDVQTIRVDGAQTLDLTGPIPLWPLCPRQALHGGRCRVGAHPAARRTGAGARRLQGRDPERPLPGQEH